MPGPSGSDNDSGRLVLVKDPRVVAVLAAAALAGATTAFAALLWLQLQGKGKGKQTPAAGGYSRGEVRQNSGANPGGR